jgi:hypothetical protein
VSPVVCELDDGGRWRVIVNGRRCIAWCANRAIAEDLADKIANAPIAADRRPTRDQK